MSNLISPCQKTFGRHQLAKVDWTGQIRYFQVFPNYLGRHDMKYTTFSIFLIHSSRKICDLQMCCVPSWLILCPVKCALISCLLCVLLIVDLSGLFKCLCCYILWPVKCLCWYILWPFKCVCWYILWPAKRICSHVMCPVDISGLACLHPIPPHPYLPLLPTPPQHPPN